MKVTRPEQMMMAAEMNSWARAVAAEYTSRKAWTTPNIKGAVRQHMHSNCLNDRTRSWIIGWLFGEAGAAIKPLYLESCSDAQWLTLKQWISATADANGEWEACPQFKQEIGWLRGMIENGAVRI